MKSRSLLVLLLAAALTPACDENAVTDIAEPQTGGASVKFFNFAPSSPQVNFYANDTKITAVSSTTCGILTDTNREQCTTTGAEAVTGIAYGSSANSASGWYSDLQTGQLTLNARIAAATDKGLQISSAPVALETGKFYSYYLSGVYDATNKTADSFVIEDVIPAIDYTTAYVRFVHAIAGLDPLTLYLKNRETLEEVALNGEVAYKNGTAFVAVPEGAYDLAIRHAGSATDVVLRANVSFADGRVYTITARGIATGAKALDNTANR